MEIFNNSLLILGSTNNTLVYTAPQVYSEARVLVVGCIVTKLTSTTSNLSISITDTNNAPLSYIAHEKPISDSIELITKGKLVLMPSQKIWAQASTANNISISLSVLEIS